MTQHRRMWSLFFTRGFLGCAVFRASANGISRWTRQRLVKRANDTLGCFTVYELLAFSEDLHLLDEAVSFRTLVTGISGTEEFSNFGGKRFSVVHPLTTKASETRPSTQTSNSCEQHPAQEIVNRAERHGTWTCRHCLNRKLSALSAIRSVAGDKNWVRRCI